ncbi:MAG: radical SAM protein [Firmicutes bacterium HGW-Firmicutes-12]|jgi:radical SAM protein with 4Fe4S-binding SPASM domain|nr:MAG: radical SAM protein [Firmicutes bacterium HGW-Firmicutes-12]
MKKYKKFYIEITNVCNLKCSFCLPTKRKPEFISITNFERIIDKIKGYTDYLYFHVKGEPLLHPNLEQLLELSFAKGLKVNLTTNGTLIQQKGSSLLKQPALRQISLSLQSYEEHTNLLKKEKYIHDILTFIKKVNLETNIFIDLRLWNSKPDNSFSSNSKQNVYFLEAIEKYLDLPFKIEERISKGQGEKIAERIYLSQDHEFEWPDITKDDVSTTGFCYGLRNQIAILVDGTVVPCCLDSEGIINLGNIYNQDFKDIIESERARGIIDNFSQRKAVEPLCKKCNYKNNFRK